MPALMPAIAKDLGLGYAASGFVFGTASLGIAVASPFGGAAVDRWGARRVAGLALVAGAIVCAARALGGWREVMLASGAVIASVALAGVAAYAAVNALMFIAIAGIAGGSFTPLLQTLPLELSGIGSARAGATLGFLVLVGQIGGFLLPVGSGAMAQAAGSPAALVALAVAHLLVIVPAVGLRTQR
jgi:MFS family permease